MQTQTDFERELARIDGQLSGIGPAALAEPLDTLKATEYVYRLYQRASLTGDMRELEEAGAGGPRRPRRGPPPPDPH